MKLLKITLEGKVYEVMVEVMNGAGSVEAPAPLAAMSPVPLSLIHI